MDEFTPELFLTGLWVMSVASHNEAVKTARENWLCQATQKKGSVSSLTLQANNFQQLPAMFDSSSHEERAWKRFKAPEPYKQLFLAEFLLSDGVWKTYIPARGSSGCCCSSLRPSRPRTPFTPPSGSATGKCFNALLSNQDNTRLSEDPGLLLHTTHS
ncbi:hypothetical protein EYF80_002463 [Liparis tanakae]|uniref:Uncharacterized protein n=1 Tax=Liparis tanakae TaxID=230148 RepID=A0A4Z2JB97_9TELE|nr:hypothetical protein EYF80_002463 [Liparis tanakae]